ncbi:MAG TPA: cell division protein FtsQ/DivIB [Actinotalea sp.]|nr:cell division protein FtsQ/DivIB [Actinotalea sp.]
MPSGPEPSPRTAVATRSWAPVRPSVVSQGSAARFAERVTMRRRLLRDRVAAAGATGVVVVALAWLLLVSPVLALRGDEVVVQGQGTVVDPATVLSVVQAYDGVPLPRLDTVALRRSVLDVPGVRAAQVTRRWPHGLLVTVVSREPVAAVPRDGWFALLDVEGVQVGRSDVAPAGVPVITVPTDDPGARAMTAVLTVLELLPPELADQVVGASAQNQDAVRLELLDGAAVEWGSADQSALKARVLATLRASAAAAGVDVYDVSAPTLPITRS